MRQLLLRIFNFCANNLVLFQIYTLTRFSNRGSKEAIRTDLDVKDFLVFGYLLFPSKPAKKHAANVSNLIWQGLKPAKGVFLPRLDLFWANIRGQNWRLPFCKLLSTSELNSFVENNFIQVSFSNKKSITNETQQDEVTIIDSVYPIQLRTPNSNKAKSKIMSPAIMMKKLINGGDLKAAQSFLELLEELPTAKAICVLGGQEFREAYLHAILALKRQIDARFLGALGSWEITETSEPNWMPSELFPEPYDTSESNYSKAFRKYAKFDVQTQVAFGGTIMRSGKLLVSDYAQSHFFDFVAGRWSHIIGNSFNLHEAAVLLPPEGITIEAGILLASRCDSNWFHWLIETVPRLYLVPEEFEKYPLLVSRRAPREGIELLRMLTTRRIIEINEETLTNVNKLVLPGQVIFHPDSILFWKKTLTYLLDGEVLSHFRNELLLKLGPTEVPQPPKIFITRTSKTRSPFLRGVVEMTFKLLGFTIVDFAEMTGRAQLQMVAHADRIAMIGGASMANLIVSNPATKVAIFYPKSARGFDVQESLAHISGARAKTFFGPDISLIYRNLNAKKHSRFFIGPITLLKSIVFLVK